MTKAVFAIPGNKDRRTGGFIYEATVLDQLNAMGCQTAHLILPDSFPNPTPTDMERALDALRAVPETQPIIVDGLVFGAIDPAGLATVNAPLIAMIHHPLGLETGLSDDESSFLLQNEAAAIRHADHIMVPSPHTRDILVRDFGADPARTTIALPGFKRPQMAHAPADPPLILSVGLLTERKGHDVLIDALSQITDLAWQAEIVGKDHDRKTATTLREQVHRLDLTDRVRFMGELDEDTLAQRFSAASIFALATRYEGYGMVLSEAMLYGLPIVSCSVGAVPDTVGNSGILVPVDDATAFADALRQLLTVSDTYTSFQAKALIRAKALPTWEETAQKFVDAINSVSHQMI